MNRNRTIIIIVALLVVLFSILLFTTFTQTSGISVTVPDEVPHGQSFDLKSEQNVSWDVDNDGAFEQKGRNITHIYSKPGKYTIIVKYKGEKSQYSIEAVNKPPNASFTTSETVSVSESVDFDASNTTDANGDNLEFEWDVNEDGEVEKKGEQISYEYTQNGNYTVSLTVTDPYGRKNTIEQELKVEKRDNPCSEISYRGKGTKSNPYKVSNETQLECMSILTWEQFGNIEKSYPQYVELVRDINIDSLYFKEGALVPHFYLDGNNHTITGLDGQMLSQRLVGLFEEKIVIKNLRLRDVQIDNPNGGSLVDQAGNVTFNNVHVEGTTYNGGFVSEAESVVVKNSTYEGKFTGGGFVSNVQDRMLVTNSSVSGSFVVGKKFDGQDSVSGLLHSGPINASDVQVNLNVTAGPDSLGRIPTQFSGIVGKSEDAHIENAVVRANITAQSAEYDGREYNGGFEKASGIAGRLKGEKSSFDEPATHQINNVAFVGSLEGAKGEDGVKGRNDSVGLVRKTFTDVAIRSSFVVADGTDDAISSSSAYEDSTVDMVYFNNDLSDSNLGTGLSTEQMQGESARDNMNLDFEDTWMITNGYPQLKSLNMNKNSTK